MKRHIEARLHVNGTLIARSALHVGGIGSDATAALALATNGDNQLYIPGTSLAGALREWTRRLFGTNHLVQELWGYQPPPGTSRDTGRASHVFVEDALVMLPPGQRVEVRDGVGIDRSTGTAAGRTKYDRAVLPCGTRIPLDMTMELPCGENADCFRALIGELLRALQRKAVQLGAAKTRGLGLVELIEVRIREYSLITPAGILAALQDSGTVLTPEEIPPYRGERTPSRRVHAEIHWQPRGPLMVRAARGGMTVDMLPLVSATGDGGTISPVLPGSSIKGALRSQAERIVCTVLNLRDGGDHLQQRAVPVVPWLFGSPGQRDDKPDADDTCLKEGLGALTVQDCFPDEVAFTHTQWQRVVTAETGRELYAGLKDAGMPDAQRAFHVAIDRWTGGTADGALYTVLEPHGVAWQPMHLMVDFRRIPPAEQFVTAALLLLTLRDLSAGRIPLGFGVNRGMGTVSVKSIVFSVDASDDSPLARLCELSLVDEQICGPQDVLSELTSAWMTWISEWREKEVNHVN